MQNAEKSIQTILKRVDVETSNLEKAVEDLNAANRRIETDFIWKLKNSLHLFIRLHHNFLP